jgi:hypothetical protein
MRRGACGPAVRANRRTHMHVPATAVGLWAMAAMPAGSESTSAPASCVRAH